MSSLLNRFIGAVAVLSLSLMAAPASAAPTATSGTAAAVHRSTAAIASLSPGALTATAAGGNTVNLSWTNPPEPDFVDLKITRRRTDADVSMRPPDPVLLYVGRGTSFQDRTAAQDAWYVYEATFRDRLGNTTSVQSAGVVNPSGLTWGAAKPVAPFVGIPVDVSCPTTTWCMVVDGSGRAIRHSGGAWGTPAQVIPARPMESGAILQTVECPTTSFCIATGPYGTAVYRSGTWSELDPAGPTIGRLSCASATRCVAMVANNSISTFNGTSWSPPTARTTILWSLSCPTTTFCAVTGVDRGVGLLYTLTGTAWKLVRMPYEPMGEISCSSASFCLAASFPYVTYRAGTWAPAALPRAQPTFREFSCTSATSCVGVNSAGAAGRWNGSSWTPLTIPKNTTNPDATGALDCATSTFCRYVNGNGATAVFNGTAWTSAVEFDRTAGGITDFDCLTPSHCLATDMRGKWYRFNGITWSSPWSLSTPTRQTSGQNLIDCVGTSWCMALGYRSSTWRTYSASTGTWGAVHTPANFSPNSLTCVDPSWCVAGNEFGDLWRFNGTSWTKWRSLVTGKASLGLDAVECQSRTSCVVVAEGAWARWYGSYWTTSADSRLSSRASLMSCKSATRCIVRLDVERFAQLSGRTWSLVDNRQNVSNFACRTNFDCLGYRRDWPGAFSIFDGRTEGTWFNFMPGFEDMLGPDVMEISCPLPKVCAAYNNRYQVSLLR